MKIKEETLLEVIDYLQGTCMYTITQALNSFGLEYKDLDQEDFEFIDEHIMCCEECGWWEETGYMDGNCVCEECQQQIEEGDIA